MNNILKQNKLFMFLLLINLLAMIALYFFCIHKPNHREPKFLIIKELQFNEAQIAMYENYIIEHKSQIKKEQNQLIQLKKKLYNTLNFNVNHTENEQIIEQIAQHYKNIERINYQHFLKIKSLCTTEEQKQKFKTLSLKFAELFLLSPKKKPH